MKQSLILLLLIAVAIACGNKENNTKQGPKSDKVAVDGAKIYKLNCELCHGPDGKLAANGSKDLTLSDLDLDERILQISKGKGVMVAYENILSLAEIRAVAQYTMTLK
ncbi:MAG: cytochrome c [Saprospiraceae bacterium]|nr:cytochrome c [Saprospiraceae bacterium]